MTPCSLTIAVVHVGAVGAEIVVLVVAGGLEPGAEAVEIVVELGADEATDQREVEPVGGREGGFTLDDGGFFRKPGVGSEVVVGTPARGVALLERFAFAEGGPLAGGVEHVGAPLAEAAVADAAPVLGDRERHAGEGAGAQFAEVEQGLGRPVERRLVVLRGRLGLRDGVAAAVPVHDLDARRQPRVWTPKQLGIDEGGGRAGVLLPLVAVAVREDQPVGEGFGLVDRTGQVERGLVGLVRADPQRQFAPRAEEGLGGDVVDFATDRSAADEHGHRTFGDFDAVDVLRVEAVELAQAVAERAVVGLSAEAGHVGLRIAAPGAGREIPVRRVFVQRDRAGIGKGAEESAFAGVAEELGVEHRDRKRCIHQCLSDAGGGHRVLDPVAGVLGAAHFEDGEGQRLVDGGGGGGGGRGRRGNRLTEGGEGRAQRERKERGRQGVHG
jgi:hypothetical protein